MPPLRRLPPRAAALLALLAISPLLAGCSNPSPPQTEVTGATGLDFAFRPIGSQQGTDVVWTARIVNKENATSAPATLHLSVQSSVTGRSSEPTVPVSALPPQGTQEVQVHTPYDGLGDYSGVAEIQVGSRVVARALIFYEKCTGPC